MSACEGRERGSGEPLGIYPESLHLLYQECWTESKWKDLVDLPGDLKKSNLLNEVLFRERARSNEKSPAVPLRPPVHNLIHSTTLILPFDSVQSNSFSGIKRIQGLQQILLQIPSAWVHPPISIS